MDAAKLKSLLAPQSGRVAVRKADFAGTSVARVIDECYAGVDIVITNAVSAARPHRFDVASASRSADDAVVLRGRSTFAPEPGVTPPVGICDVEATFRTVTPGKPDSDVSMQIRYALVGTAPDGWKFSQTFPNLPATFDFRTKLSDEQVSTLDRLTLTNASFVVSTESHEDVDFKVTLPEGIGFVADLKPDGVLGLFERVVGNRAALVLHGSIAVPKTNASIAPLPAEKYPWTAPSPPPGIHLEADLGDDIGVESAMLAAPKLRFFSPVSAGWWDANPTWEACMAYTGTLNLPSAGIAVPLVSMMHPGIDAVQLAAVDIEGVSLGNAVAHLDRLTDVFGDGGKGLSGVPPAGLTEKLSDLQVLSVAVDLQPSPTHPFRVNYSYVKIGFKDTRWAVFPNHIEISEASVRFLVTSPFDSPKLSVALGAVIDVEGARFLVQADESFFMSAELVDTVDFPLKKVMDKYVPGAELPVGDFSIDAAAINVDPGHYYSFFISVADKTPWKIDVGKVGLVVSDVTVFLSRVVAGQSDGVPRTPNAGTGVVGSFSGKIAFNDRVTFAVNYHLHESFEVRGDVPAVTLAEILDGLCSVAPPLPDALKNIAFENSVVIIRKDNTGFVFSFGTHVADIGAFALEVMKTPDGWGVAAGFMLTAEALGKVPGLSALERFAEIFTFNNAALVLCSTVPSDFQFPDMSTFNQPAGRIARPSTGFVKGINLHAEIALAGNKELETAQRFLGVKAGLVVDVDLAISPPPTMDMRLTASVDATINGLAFAAILGAEYKSDALRLFVAGRITTTLEGNTGEKAVIQVEGDFDGNGVIMEGSYSGPPIPFFGLQLSDLGLAVGFSGEGIPSLGIAATIDGADFETSVVIFFNADFPEKSMFAGSVSKLNLKQVVDALVGRAAETFDGPLHLVGISGTREFSIDAGLAAALDTRDISAVSTAFMESGGVAIPSDINQVTLVVNTPGKVWHITDRSDDMKHYELRLGGNRIKVSLEAQILCVPDPTQIGLIRFDKRELLIAGRLDFFGFHAVTDIDIEPGQGMSLYTDISPIEFMNGDLFKISGFDGSGDPILSAATYSRKTLPQPAPNAELEAAFKKPHLYVSGEVSFLQVAGGAVLIEFDEHHMLFEFKGKRIGVDFDVHGSFSLTNVNAGGSIDVGLHFKHDFGLLGTVDIDVGAGGHVDVGFDASNPNQVKSWAKLGAYFEWKGTVHDLDCDIELAIGANPFVNIGDRFLEPIKDFFEGEFKVAEKWMVWAKNGLVEGFDDAKKLAQALASEFKKDIHAVAAILKQDGFPIDEISAALKHAFDATAAQVAQALRGLGYAFVDIAKTLKTVFNAGWRDVAGIIHALGCGISELAQILKSIFGVGWQEAGQFFHGVGHRAEEIGGVLKNVWGVASHDAAAFFHGLGVEANEVAGVLRRVFNTSAAEASGILKALGYPAQTIATVVSGVFGVGANEMAGILKSLGFGVNEIATIMRGVFGQSASQVATLLKSLGYAGGVVNAALGAAGYAANEIAGAMTSAFDWAKKNLNPSNW